MNRNEWKWVIALLGVLTALFFYKTVFLGLVPFPGDSLMSDFQPWRSSSYMGYAAGGVPSKAQYPDVIRQIYPWKTLAVEAMRNGRLPLWNPYNFSGAPLLANFQSAALYPLNIFYLFISQISAWTVLVMLQPILALLFTYLFARKIGINPWGSALAALSYGFSGFMSVWLQYNTVGHVIVWLPLMLLSIEHLRQKPKALWLGILTMANAASLLAGHPQVYAYVAIFTVLYAVNRLKPYIWPYFLGSTVLGVGISGLQLIPGIELISHAARSPHNPDVLFSKILIQPWQMLSLPFPNIFGNPATRSYWPADTFVGKVTTIGLVPLFFSFSSFRRKDTVTRWFLFATVIAFLLITANPITFVLYRIPIPLLTSSSPTLMSFLFAFALSVVCGSGLDYWMTDRHSVKKLLVRACEVIALIGLLWAATRVPFMTDFSSHAGVVTRALLYGAAVSVATLTLFWCAIVFPKYRTLSIAILLVVHTLDLFMFFNRFNPFVPRAFVFPNHPVLTFLKNKSPDRYWGYGTAGIAANFASQYHLYSPEGYDPLYPISYGQYFYSYRRGLFNSFDTRTRSDASITSYFGDGGLNDIHKQNLLNSLSVRYILDRSENGSTEITYPPEIYKPVYSDTDWNVYENTQAAKRAYFAERIYIAPDARSFNDVLLDGTFDSSSSAILTIPPIESIGSLSVGTVSIQSFLPEYIRIETENMGTGVLVVTDSYYPGWSAMIDNKPTRIYTANWALRSVVVPPGKHTIVMKYAPNSVTNGLFVSIISLVVTGIVLYVTRRKFS